MSGPKQEVNQVSTTPEALGPAVGTAVETQQQLLPQQANLLQQLGGLILGGQAPGQQAFGQAQDFISQAAGLAGGAQGLQGDPQSILQQFGGFSGGGIGGGGLTRSGSGDILGLAQQFLQQGAQATQPAFDLASQQAFGQLRQFAPNISSTAFQEQGIDLGSRLGNFVQIERGHLEHFAGALAIAGRDHGRVDVEEPFLLEKLVDRVADTVPHSGNGPESVGARPQVGDGTKKLERMSLLLQRIALDVGQAVDDYLLGLDLGRLPLAGRLFDQSDHADATAGRELFDFRLVVFQFGVGDDLDIVEAGAVVELDEAEAGLAVAARTNPTL
ncbi:hypothetical protein LCGC14_3004300 [marine sediment metagenome]|uniref:Uncharacterized protein n=1 Tax=marine sediment metagenome TaxID=412755 RepID=A0A0F8XMR7_9ZZZZ